MPQGKIISQNATSVTFSHPDVITHTVKATRQITEKNVNGQKVPHVRTDLVHNKQVPVKICENSCAGSETLSIRTSISGSPKSAADIVKMITDHKAILDQYVSDKGQIGFPITQITFSE